MLMLGSQTPILAARCIGRTITLTLCTGQRVNKDGEFETVDYVFIGKVTPKQATRRLRKAFNDETININKTEQDTDYYKMPLSRFLAVSLAYMNEENGDSDND